MYFYHAIYEFTWCVAHTQAHHKATNAMAASPIKNTLQIYVSINLCI